MCVVSSFVVGSPDGAVSFSLNAPRPMHLSFLVSSSFVYVTFSSLPTVSSSSFFPWDKKGEELVTRDMTTQGHVTGTRQSCHFLTGEFIDY